MTLQRAFDSGPVTGLSREERGNIRFEAMEGLAIIYTTISYSTMDVQVAQVHPSGLEFQTLKYNRGKDTTEYY